MVKQQKLFHIPVIWSYLLYKVVFLTQKKKNSCYKQVILILDKLY